MSEEEKAVTVEGEDAPKETETELGQTVGRVTIINPYKQPHEVEGAEALSETHAHGTPVTSVSVLGGVDTVVLAGDMYGVYSQAVGGVNFQGDDLPTWEEFSADKGKTLQSSAWLAVAQYVIDTYK